MTKLTPLPNVQVLSIDSIDELAKRIPHFHRYFTLFLAWDTPDIKEGKLMDIFRPLVNRGLAYFCAWGARCEDAHDAVDMCVVESEIESGESDHLLMTTWHSDEPLEEALSFFETLAIPAENQVFDDFERFAVSVGNPTWATEMERVVSAVERNPDD